MDSRTAPAPVVRTIARGGGRPCSRPQCAAPANATLVMSYLERTARVADLLDERDPQAYDLCDPHAARTTAPRGWEFVDDRSPRPLPPPRRDVDELGATVRLLAAALRGDDPAGASGAEAGVDIAEGVDAAAQRAGDGPVGTDAGPTTQDAPEVMRPVDTRPGARAQTEAGEEDPLRAALEAVQDVVDPDPDSPGAEPVQLHRRRVLVVDVDDPDAEPQLW